MVTMTEEWVEVERVMFFLSLHIDIVKVTRNHSSVCCSFMYYLDCRPQLQLNMTKFDIHNFWLLSLCGRL